MASLGSRADTAHRARTAAENTASSAAQNPASAKRLRFTAAAPASIARGIIQSTQKFSVCVKIAVQKKHSKVEKAAAQNMSPLRGNEMHNANVHKNTYASFSGTLCLHINSRCEFIMSKNLCPLSKAWYQRWYISTGDSTSLNPFGASVSIFSPDRYISARQFAADDCRVTMLVILLEKPTWVEYSTAATQNRASAAALVLLILSFERSRKAQKETASDTNAPRDWVCIRKHISTALHASATQKNAFLGMAARAQHAIMAHAMNAPVLLMLATP